MTVDGSVVAEGPLTQVSVGGARHRAGTFQLLPRSVLTTASSTSATIGEVDAAGFAELAGLIVGGTHLARPEVGYAQGRLGRDRTHRRRAAGGRTDGDVEPGAGGPRDGDRRARRGAVVAPPEPVAG